MSGDAGMSEIYRALTPPGYPGADAPRWMCPQCSYTTRGTIDEPYSGDGTCPHHSRQALRLVQPDDYLAGTGETATGVGGAGAGGTEAGTE
jgi:hypothetical protein